MRTVLPNLQFCTRCPRYDRYPANNQCFCKSLVSDEQFLIGTLRFQNNDESQPAMIVYNDEFCLPHDCNFELEQLWSPPVITGSAQ